MQLVDYWQDNHKQMIVTQNNKPKQNITTPPSFFGLHFWQDQTSIVVSTSPQNGCLEGRLISILDPFPDDKWRPHL